MLNRGYTLTGLLVAMTIGVILLTAAIKFVTGLMTQQLSAIQQLDLENQVARLAILISSEVQRAGYDANAHLYFFLYSGPEAFFSHTPVLSILIHIA